MSQAQKASESGEMTTINLSPEEFVDFLLRPFHVEKENIPTYDRKVFAKWIFDLLNGDDSGQKSAILAIEECIKARGYLSSTENLDLQQIKTTILNHIDFISNGLGIDIEGMIGIGDHVISGVRKLFLGGNQDELTDDELAEVVLYLNRNPSLRNNIPTGIREFDIRISLIDFKKLISMDRSDIIAMLKSYFSTNSDAAWAIIGAEEEEDVEEKTKDTDYEQFLLPEGGEALISATLLFIISFVSTYEKTLEEIDNLSERFMKWMNERREEILMLLGVGFTLAAIAFLIYALFQSEYKISTHNKEITKVVQPENQPDIFRLVEPPDTQIPEPSSTQMLEEDIVNYERGGITPLSEETVNHFYFPGITQTDPETERKETPSNEFVVVPSSITSYITPFAKFTHSDDPNYSEFGYFEKDDKLRGVFFVRTKYTNEEGETVEGEMLAVPTHVTGFTSEGENIGGTIIVFVDAAQVRGDISGLPDRTDDWREFSNIPFGQMAEYPENKNDGGFIKVVIASDRMTGGPTNVRKLVPGGNIMDSFIDPDTGEMLDKNILGGTGTFGIVEENGETTMNAFARSETNQIGPDGRKLNILFTYLGNGEIGIFHGVNAAIPQSEDNPIDLLPNIEIIYISETVFGLRAVVSEASYNHIRDTLINELGPGKGNATLELNFVTEEQLRNQQADLGRFQ